MSNDAGNNARLLEEARAGMVERLRARQPEIKAAIFARVRAVSGWVGSEDAEYEAGLRAAVAAVVDYCLTCIEQGEEWSEPIPSAAIAQARRAARNDVSLDTIVLRYIAGHRLLGEFIQDEADHSGLSSHASRQVRRTQEAALERLTATIANEYNQECERVARSGEQRRWELVQKLLTGELVDTSELDYEFDDAWHLGVIATGARAEKAVRGLADGLARQILPVSCGEGWTVWAWLGGRRKLAITDVERLLSSSGAPGVSLAIGEPGRGIDGWRLTHQEAQAALPVALRKPQTLTRCADVPLEAAVLRHEALIRSLVGRYLSPLDNLRMGGRVARETLRHYFKCERNVSSTANSLGVNRHTVENRLHEIEKILGRLLHTCLAELEVVMRLEAFRDVASTHTLLPPQ
jgi:PucR C-terminal helix-turn-helix domain